MTKDNFSLKKKKYKEILQKYIYAIMIPLTFPLVSILGYKMPFFYLVSLLSIPLLVFLKYKNIELPKLLKKFYLLWLFLIISILIFSIFSTYRNFGYLHFPTDVFQYVFKFLIFILFSLIAYFKIMETKKFYNFLLIILLIALTIGMLQWFPWFGRVTIIKLYPFRDGMLQISQLDRPLYALRLHGFAQHATANGGFAAFAFVIAISKIVFYKSTDKLSLFIVSVSLLTVLASRARGGIIAIIFSLLIIAYFYYRLNNQTESILKKIVIIFSVLIIVTIILYFLNVPLLKVNINYFIHLVNTKGGPRIWQQPIYFFNQMSLVDYFLGLSKHFVNLSVLSYGVEVEVINILITYGLFVFIIQYTLLFYLLYFMYKSLFESKLDSNRFDRMVVVSGFTSLLTYFIFSFAHYFFREIVIGSFPWVLIGFVVGLIIRKYDETLEL